MSDILTNWTSQVATAGRIAELLQYWNELTLPDDHLPPFDEADAKAAKWLCQLFNAAEFQPWRLLCASASV